MANEMIIPSFQLTEEEQKELVSELLNRKTSTYSAYSGFYANLQIIKAAKNCKNSFEPLPNFLFSSKNDNNLNTEKDEKRPNLNIPILKQVAKQLIGPIVEATIGAGDNYFCIRATDQNDKDEEDDLIEAYKQVRKSYNAEIIDKEIIENFCYEGTCPVTVIDNRIDNAYHLILNTYEIALNQEESQMFETTSLIITEELEEVDDSYFIGIKLSTLEQYSQSSSEPESQDNNEVGSDCIYSFADDDLNGVTAYDQLQNFLVEQTGLFNIQLSRRKVINQELITKTETIEGYPIPKILDIQKTGLMPSFVCNNQAYFNWTYHEDIRLIDIMDNPHYINKDKIEQIIKGRSTIQEVNSDISYNNYGNESITAIKFDSTPLAKITLGYFDKYKFKSGKVLQHFIVESIEDQILISCQPCLNYTKQGNKMIMQNPMILFHYEKFSFSTIGTSPLFDLIDLNVAINKLMNYIMDSLPRRDNKLAYIKGTVDLQSMYGGNMVLAEIDGVACKTAGVNPKDAIFSLNHNFDDINSLNALMQSLKSEANASSDAQNSFLSNKDYSTTAREISAIASQAASITKLLIKQACSKFEQMHQLILDRLISNGCVVESIPYYNQKNNSGIYDFGKLKGKKFNVELIAINPTISKISQSSSLEKMLTLALTSGNSEILSRINISEMAEEILRLADITNKSIINDDETAQQRLQESDIKEQLFQLFQQGLIAQVNPDQQQQTTNKPDKKVENNNANIQR